MVPKTSTRVVKQQLVRRVTGVKGSTTASFKFQPAPSYGRKNFKFKVSKRVIALQLDNGILVVHLPFETSLIKSNGGYVISVQVEPGQVKDIVLEYIPEAFQIIKPLSTLEESTVTFWKLWVAKGKYFPPNKAMLIRSAITLKLMQFAPTGAIVAAPTTSLPEDIGGVRNWDYRYVWIRDATFALYAFTVLGYTDESKRFFDFVEKITDKCMDEGFDVSLMYTIWGEPVAREYELNHLTGYKNSKPVRIGNDAAEQFQLDVYGVMIDSIYFAQKKLAKPSSRPKQARLVMNLVHRIESSWQKPDSGIWEARVGPERYTYSRVMAWVGVERAKQLSKELRLTASDVELCSKLEVSIRDWIWDNCFSEAKTNFQQYPGSRTIDATNFLFVLIKFLDKHDSKTMKIINNTIEQLSIDRIFIKRYGPAKDGLPGTEGAFILCTYWLISALAIMEDIDRATLIFDQLNEYIKPHGLIPEEIDPNNKNYLGNYPQSFSHMGYIMSAHYIQKYSKRLNSKSKHS
jgi:GH15 family glucan-1,4-alpha-glucosidase